MGNIVASYGPTMVSAIAFDSRTEKEGAIAFIDHEYPQLSEILRSTSENQILTSFAKFQPSKNAAEAPVKRISDTKNLLPPINRSER